VAVCCSVWQWVAACSSMLHCADTPCGAPPWLSLRSMVQCSLLNVLQCVAVCCSAAVCCSVLQCADAPRCRACLSCMGMLQCVAVCCTVLHSVAVCRCTSRCSACLSPFDCPSFCLSVFRSCCLWYGVSTWSRLLKIIGLFCRMSSLL